MATVSGPLRIRPVRPDDGDALFEIGLGTADDGSDATGLYGDPRLPGPIWAMPYGALEPEFAFVLATNDGPLGYGVGTPDTARFARRLEAEWWPGLREAVAGRVPHSRRDGKGLFGMKFNV